MKKVKEKKWAEKDVNEFFKNLNGKEQKEIKKMKRRAMSYNIKLKDKRKKFCKFCYSPLQGRVRINKKVKSIICGKCGKESRWRVR